MSIVTSALLASITSSKGETKVEIIKSSDKGQQLTFSYQELIEKCEDFSAFADPVYSNFTRLNVDNANFYIDYFLVTPTPDGKDNSPMAKPILRMMVPLDHLKGLATAMANVAHMFEQVTGTQLPNLRAKQENDGIEIW